MNIFSGGKLPSLMIWKRDGGLFFETSSVEQVIKYLEDEIEKNDELLVAMEYFERE
jgi:hypothetical protein